MKAGSRRYILILGAMKSGTTTLFDHLARHPAIAPANPKEPGFFAFDDVFDRGLDWYDGLFQSDAATQWRLDGSTDHAKAPFVTGIRDRMARVAGAEFRLLYIMRDPLKRIESHARHVQRTKKEIGQVISPRPDHALGAGVSPVSLAVSDYAAQLDAWAPEWEAGRLHALTLEALTRDPDATLAGIWEFLGLDPLATDLPTSNAAGTKVAMPAMARRLDHLAGAAGLGRLVPKPLRRAIRQRLKAPVEVEGRFRLNEDERAALGALYAPGVARLAADYGVDISDWSPELRATSAHNSKSRA